MKSALKKWVLNILEESMKTTCSFFKNLFEGSFLLKLHVVCIQILKQSTPSWVLQKRKVITFELVEIGN